MPFATLQRLLLAGLPAVLLFAARLDGAEAAPAEQPLRPNILFILADDLGWGDLSCYGNQRVRTPNLDRLATQGTLFTHFYVNGSVCSPTRAAFMTSQYPARLGIHGHFASHEQNAARAMPDWLDPERPTVTRLLQQAGYATAHFGKWHLGSGEGAPDPGAYGIDVHRTLNSNGPGWGEEERDPYFRARSTSLFVDETIRFIQEHREGPFYINLWTLLTHATLNPTEEQMKPFARLNPGGKVPHKAAATIYFASLADLDAQIGRLMRALDELGVADNTLVIFSSDNGPEDLHVRNASHSGVGSAGPFRGRKRSLYEGGIRTPLIVRWPGRVPAGRVNDHSVLSGVDLLPTACSLAGVPLPEGLEPDGEDVSDMLMGDERQRSKPLFWEWRFRIMGHVLHRSPSLAMRDAGPWKLLMNPDGGRVELYDIPHDPSELNNLAAERPDVVRRMARALLRWSETLPEGPVAPQAGSADYPWPGTQP